MKFYNPVIHVTLYITTLFTITRVVVVDATDDIPTKSSYDIKSLEWNNQLNYHTVPSFSIKELISGSKDDELTNILTSTGLIAIRVPSTTNLLRNKGQQHLLSGLCSCNQNIDSLIQNIGVSDSRKVKLDDGITTRYTIGTATVGSDPIHLPHEHITQHCGYDVNYQMEVARDVVSYASSKAFIPALDRIISKNHLFSYMTIEGKEEAAPTNTILLESMMHGKGYSSVSDIVKDSVHLEHFHLYSQTHSADENYTTAAAHNSNINNPTTTALDWHTDAGLFLAFLPALPCHHSTNPKDNNHIHQKVLDDAFRIHVPGEGEKIVVFPDNVLMDSSRSSSSTSSSDDEETIVAFMLGSGAQHWLNIPSSLQLRATTHAVKINQGDIRAWYGMMHLVPSDAIIQSYPEQRTFAEMKISALHRYSENDTQASKVTIGCGNHNNHDFTPLSDDGSLTNKSDQLTYRRRLQHVSDATDCDGSSNFFCWTMCLGLPSDDTLTSAQHFDKGESLYCVDPAILASTSSLKAAVEACTSEQGVVGGTHNTNCGNFWHQTEDHVTSYHSKPKDSSGGNIEEKYCYGATAMYMQGFEWEGITCVVYLFKSWVLSTPGSLVGACFGTIALGIFLEYVIMTRRGLVFKNEKPIREILHSALLYGVQLTLGYFLMLVVMSYSAPLFMSVVMGLVLGHVIFNYGKIKNTAVGGSTPCCQYDLSTDERKNTEGATGDIQSETETQYPCCCDNAA